MAKASVSVSTHIPKSLEKDLDSLATSISRTIAQYSKNYLAEAQEEILNDYYRDYYPKRYKRTNQLLKKSYKGIYKSPHGAISYGGIVFTPERMHYNKKASVQYGAANIISDFLDGWHGGAWNQYSVQASFVPWNRLMKARNYLIADLCDGSLGQELITIAKSKANLTTIS